MTKKGTPYGYICPFCQEAIYDGQDTVHSANGLAHAKCPGSDITVEAQTRTVIENKLIAALNENRGQVAILATEQDLEDLIAALQGWVRAEYVQDDKTRLSWEAFERRKHQLGIDLTKLLNAAFPKAK